LPKVIFLVALIPLLLIASPSALPSISVSFVFAAVENCDDGVVIDQVHNTTDVYDGATNGTHKCGGGAFIQHNDPHSPPNTHQPVYGCLQGVGVMTMTNDSKACVTGAPYPGYYPWICLANCRGIITHGAYATYENGTLIH